MKKIVFSLMVLVIALATACNQGSNSNSQSSGDSGQSGRGDFNLEEMADRQIKEMDELLDLSSKQEKQMREIIEEGFDNMQKMREEMEKDGGGFEGMREQMQNMREDQNVKTKAILSEEQWGKYDTYQQDRRSRRGQGRSGGQGRPE